MGIFGKIEKGLIFVVSAPAGTGKTTLVEMLIAKHPTAMQRSVSCTTRAPRGKEKEGTDYYFITLKEFEKRIQEEAFLEYAKVFNHYYGTLKETVKAIQEQGKHVFLVIDTQGALELKAKIEGVFIFIVPPDMETLRERLQQRHTDANEEIDLRLSYAAQEMEKAQYYDHVIMNKDLQKAYQDFKALVEQKEKEYCKYI
jgi:guanylate kinase